MNVATAQDLNQMLTRLSKKLGPQDPPSSLLGPGAERLSPVQHGQMLFDQLRAINAALISRLRPSCTQTELTQFHMNINAINASLTTAIAIPMKVQELIAGTLPAVSPPPAASTPPAQTVATLTLPALPSAPPRAPSPTPQASTTGSPIFPQAWSGGISTGPTPPGPSAPTPAPAPLATSTAPATSLSTAPASPNLPQHFLGRRERVQNFFDRYSRPLVNTLGIVIGFLGFCTFSSFAAKSTSLGGAFSNWTHGYILTLGAAAAWGASKICLKGLAYIFNLGVENRINSFARNHANIPAKNLQKHMFDMIDSVCKYLKLEKEGARFKELIQDVFKDNEIDITLQPEHVTEEFKRKAAERSSPELDAIINTLYRQDRNSIADPYMRLPATYTFEDRIKTELKGLLNSKYSGAEYDLAKLLGLLMMACREVHRKMLFRRAVKEDQFSKEVYELLGPSGELHNNLYKEGGNFGERIARKFYQLFSVCASAEKVTAISVGGLSLLNSVITFVKPEYYGIATRILNPLRDLVDKPISLWNSIF